MRHHVARRRSRRPDARHAQRDADEPLRHRPLRLARTGNGARHRLEAMRQPQRRAHAGAARVHAAADGAREELRHRVRVRVAGGGRPARADPAHRRSRRCRVDSRRRQGESHRPHPVARERRADARRDDRRRRQGHGRRPRGGSRHGRPLADGRRRGSDRLRIAGQLRRPVGPRVRTPCGRQRAALRGRALLPRHQGDSGRGDRHAGDPRSRRLPLLQGGSRRASHGRLRAEGEAVDGGSDSRRLRVPAAARGLGSLRDPDAKCDPSHALPRDRRSEAAAERAGELHARRQLHPRRSAGAVRLFRLRRLQLGRHRERRRRGQARRRMDRQRRAPRSTCGTSTRGASRRSTPIAGTWPTARSRRSASTTRCAGRARSWRRSVPCADRRSTIASRPSGRCSAAR